MIDRAGTAGLACLLSLALTGCGGGHASGAQPPSRTSTTSTPASSITDADFGAVRALMRTRASAVLHHDRSAFLATVDPEQPHLMTAQETLYDNLTQFGLATLTYTVGSSGLDPDPVPGGDPTLRPEVYEHAQIQGAFSRPITNPVDDTFVERDGTWLVGSETQTDTSGQYDSPEERPWFGVPITVVHEGPVTVVTDASDRDAARPLRLTVASDLTSDAGLLDVSEHVPVLVDATSNGLAAELNTTSGEEAGAVTFAVFSTDALDTERKAVVGHVIKVNPHDVDDEINYPPLLRHEITHLLLHDYSGVAPKWATEGIAEYVGDYPHRSTSLRPGTSAYHAVLDSEHLIPVSGNFGAHPDADYQIAESAVHYLVATYGMGRFEDLLALYRKDYDLPFGDELTPRLLRQEYGISLDTLDDATWRTLAELPGA